MSATKALKLGGSGKEWQERELKQPLAGKDDDPGMKPFSWYQKCAFHTADLPDDPTFLYLGSLSAPVIPVWLRSIAWYSILAVVAVLLVTVRVVQFVQQNATMIFLADFLFKLVIVLAVRWPQKESKHVNNPDYLRKIGCLVPCHKSADEIADTVSSLLRFLEPEHILVLDNGNSVTELDNTREVLEKLEPRVRYMWIPVGNKTNALWKGLNEMPSSVQYVMHIDDDTDLPEDFVFDESIWKDPRVSSTSYSIEMKRTGFVEKLVDWEFRYIAQLRSVESKYSTVWFQHGIIGIWRREDLTRTMCEHPCMYFGEDGWNGVINLLRGKKMLQEMRCSVSTFAPSVLVPGCGGSREQGFGAANIWKQRIERWNVTPPRRLWLRLYLFFTYVGDGFMDNLVFRIITFHHMSCIFFALLTPFALGMHILAGEWAHLLQYKLQLIGFSFLKNAVMNYIALHHRPDLQIDFLVVLASPFYFLFLGVTAVAGNWRSVLSYIPLSPLRFGLYTWGRMTPAKLKAIHGIDCINDFDDEKSSTDDSDDAAVLQAL